MNDKVCDKCSHKLAANQKFCPECGHSVAGDSTKNKSNSHFLKESLVVTAFVVLTALVFYFLNGKSESLRQVNNPPLSGSMDQVSMAMLDNLPDDYETLVQMGNEFMDNQNFPVASEIYNRALAIDDSSPDVRTDYGACLHGMGLPERAIEEFKRALEISPNHAITNFNLGIVFNQMKQLDSAQYYFTVYLKLEPNGRASTTARQLLKGSAPE